MPQIKHSWVWVVPIWTLARCAQRSQEPSRRRRTLHPRSHRQQRSRHRQPSLYLVHRLLFQNHHRQRSQEPSRRRRTLHPRSTFMSTLRKSSLYMKSTSSRMSHLRTSRPSPDNVDLPVYFVYHRYNKHWTLIKGPTSKFYDVVWYEYIEQFYKRGTKQRNSAYWYNTLEKSCSDPLGGGRGPLLLRLVSPSYLGMTYSK